MTRVGSVLSPDWTGEPAFVICGGPSVKQWDLNVLRGRRVVVINASFKVAPWANVLFFADSNPWKWYREDLMAFKGSVATVYDSKPSNRYPERFEQYRKVRPFTLSNDPSCLAMQRTSVTGVINYLAHRGVRQIVTLGLDGKRGENGESHHHGSHPKPAQPGCWEKHRKEFLTVRPSIEAWGIEVLNASPGSACDVFPVMTLPEALSRVEMRIAA